MSVQYQGIVAILVLSVSITRLSGVPRVISCVNVLGGKAVSMVGGYFSRPHALSKHAGSPHSPVDIGAYVCMGVLMSACMQACSRMCSWTHPHM